MSKKVTYNIGDIINGMEYLGEAGFILRKSGNKQRKIKLKCFCGKVFTPFFGNVRIGYTNSCGCKKDNMGRKPTHGMSQDKSMQKVYGIWSRIKKDACDEWSQTPIAFSEWWTKNKTIEKSVITKIKDDLPYSPNNCKFISTYTAYQRKKETRVNKCGYRGVYPHSKRDAFVSQIGANGKRIFLGVFETALEAAKAYDDYVIANNLEHPINGV